MSNEDHNIDTAEDEGRRSVLHSWCRSQFDLPRMQKERLEQDTSMAVETRDVMLNVKRRGIRLMQWRMEKTSVTESGEPLFAGCPRQCGVTHGFA